MKCWPIIRHVRWAIYVWKVERHYAFWSKFGMLPVNRRLDEEVLDKIWRGEM